MRRRGALAAALAAAALEVGGCNALLGIEDGTLATERCEPSSTAACTVADSEAGACSGGTKTCKASGDGYGPCVTDVTLAPEACSPPAEEECDGGGGCAAECDGGGGCGTGPSGALLGGPGAQEADAIAADAEGGAVVAGRFVGSLDLGGEPISSSATEDVFVARFDAGGGVTWARTLLMQGAGRARAVAVSPAGVVAVAGELHGELSAGGVSLSAPQPSGFVITLDAAGEPLWGATSPALPQAAAMTASGRVIVAATLLDAAEGEQIALTCHLPTGTELWSAVHGGPGDQAPTGVAVDDGGRIHLTGSFEGALSLDGGASSLLSAGGSDVFLAALDDHGALIEAARFGDAADQRGGDVVAGPGGLLALSGAFEGVIDIDGVPLAASGPSAFLAVRGPGGLAFSRSFAANKAPRLAMGAGGEVLVAGELEGSIDLGGGTLTASPGGVDLYAGLLDAGGMHVWSRRFGASADARRLGGVAIAPGGDALIAGAAEGRVDFGAGSIAADGVDVLFVRLPP